MKINRFINIISENKKKFIFLAIYIILAIVFLPKLIRFIHVKNRQSFFDQQVKQSKLSYEDFLNYYIIAYTNDKINLEIEWLDKCKSKIAKYCRYVSYIYYFDEKTDKQKYFLRQACNLSENSSCTALKILTNSDK